MTIARGFFALALGVLLVVVMGTPVQAKNKLKIGLLPIHDTLLFHVAQKNGYFAEQGLEVELVPFHSALEKDVAARAGQLDGHFSDLSSVIVQQAGGSPFVVVASTSHTNLKQRMFGLVTSPQNASKSLAELKGAKLAVARQSIVDFLSDVLLVEYGPDFMARQDIRKIPVRLQLLLAGQVDAALLPEPLLSLVEEAGGKVLLDDRALDMPLAVLALTKIKATPQVVASLHRALVQAGETINRDLVASNQLLLEFGLIPPNLAKTFKLPPVDLSKIPHTLPSQELYESYGNWLVKSGVLARAPGQGGLPVLPPYRVVVPGESGSSL